MSEETEDRDFKEFDTEDNYSAGVEGGADSSSEIPSGIRSIKDLIDRVTGRNLVAFEEEDSGISEQWPFPFLAIVGQKDMKLGLVLALINPNIGGVLLIGPRGTGKTTAVRSLIDLMPYVEISNCYYGCMEEDIEIGGIDSLCPNCIEKVARGERLSSLRPAKLVELPLNATLEDVLGSIDDRVDEPNRTRIKRGILSSADRNLLYIDEVNLLNDEIVDVILDASAQGGYTVRRGQFSATYRSAFTLIGTMNPEEGALRPQIMDRFGLRLIVKGLEELEERKEAYERARAYLNNPKSVVNSFADETMIARDEIEAARNLLPEVEIPEGVANAGLELIQKLGIASLRAEITMFEAARALAAADGRKLVNFQDLSLVAPMALRLRGSNFIDEYFVSQQLEEDEIAKELKNFPDEENY